MKKSLKFLSTVLIAVSLSACQNPFAVDDDDDDSTATVPVSSTSRGSSATSTDSTSTSSDSGNSSASNDGTSTSENSSSSDSTATSSDDNSAATDNSSGTSSDSDSTSDDKSTDSSSNNAASSSTTTDDSNSASSTDSSSKDSDSAATDDSTATSSDSENSSSENSENSDSSSSADGSSSSSSSENSSSSSSSSENSDSSSDVIVNHADFDVTIDILEESSSPKKHWVNHIVCSRLPGEVLEAYKNGKATLYLGYKPSLLGHLGEWKETPATTFFRNDAQLIKFENDDLYLNLFTDLVDIGGNHNDFSDCLKIGRYYLRVVYNGTEYKSEEFHISLYSQLEGFINKQSENSWSY